MPDSTGIARFGVEARTVDARDLANCYGAPNVEGEALRVAEDWFRHVGEGTPPTAIGAR